MCLSTQEGLKKERPLSNGDLVSSSGSIILCDRQKQVPRRTHPPVMINLNHTAQKSVCLDGRLNVGCAPRLDMTVAEFAQWWNMHKAGQDERLLYLKDWHFTNEFPDYKAYHTPCYFQEDWLNEFYDIRQRRPPQNHMAGSADDTPQAGDAADKGDAQEGVADGDMGGGSNAGCDVASSDYRFVYLGCKVQFLAFHILEHVCSDICTAEDTLYFVLTTHNTQC